MSINRGIDKEDVVHTYSGMSLSYKKGENNSTCHKKNRLRDCLTEWSKSDREQQMSYITYMQNLTKKTNKNLTKKRNYTNELIHKTERQSQM